MDFIAGLFAGFIIGVVFMCSAMGDFERIYKSESGMFIGHKDKVYELTKVKQK